MDFLNPILKTVNQFGIAFLAHIPHMIVGLIILILTFFMAKLMAKIVGISLSRIWIRPNLVIIFQKIAVISVWVFGLLIVFAVLFPSVTPANILAAVGLTSIAVGFAFKDIFENFFAGILILLREPFRHGDFIETKEEKGFVEHVSVRNTHLRRSDGVRVVIPNGILFNNPMRVVTDRSFRRVKLDLSVDSSSDIEKTRDVIKSCLEKSQSVNKEEYMQIYLKSFSANGVDFEVYWWTKSKPGEVRYSVNEVLSHLKTDFDKAGIEYPYATTISFQQAELIKDILQPIDKNEQE